MAPSVAWTDGIGKRIGMGLRNGRDALLWWLGGFAFAAAACAFCVRYIDRPVSSWAGSLFGTPRPELLTYPWLIMAMMFAVLCFAERRAEGRGLSHLAQTLVLAGFALAWGVCTDEFLLKPFFGRMPPVEWLLRGNYYFHWFFKSENGSFPSGHSVQLAAIATVFWSAYPRWRWFYICAIAVLSVCLVAGNWHFVSDVISGLFVGLTAGLIVQALWTGVDKSPTPN